MRHSFSWGSARDSKKSGTARARRETAQRSCVIILEISRQESEDDEYELISLIEVNPADIPPSTGEDKNELLKILEKTGANGEISLSQFCVPMGT